jgi:hypothetical protein
MPWITPGFALVTPCFAVFTPGSALFLELITFALPFTAKLTHAKGRKKQDLIQRE